MPYYETQDMPTPFEPQWQFGDIMMPSQHCAMLARAHPADVNPYHLYTTLDGFENVYPHSILPRDMYPRNNSNNFVDADGSSPNTNKTTPTTAYFTQVEELPAEYTIGLSPVYSNLAPSGFAGILETPVSPSHWMDPTFQPIPYQDDVLSLGPSSGHIIPSQTTYKDVLMPLFVIGDRPSADPHHEGKLQSMKTRRDVSTLAEARAWREGPHHTVPGFISTAFEQGRDSHVRALETAMQDLGHALDGPRSTQDGRKIAPSKGWLAIHGNKHQSMDFKAAAIVTWNCLVCLYRLGTALDLQTLPGPVAKAAKFEDLSLEPAERLQRLVELYSKDKQSVVEAIQGDEMGIMKHVRAPSGFLTAKAEYRRTNESRKGKGKVENTAPSPSKAEDEDYEPAKKRRRQ